ncbi:hypothetical protein [Streptomyces acidicola]|uniref:Uncharacterized protein n=1 Tax=Streptomyces acidicola TaxID=2596892 RepID=A0A5N8WNC2_9ACTN|nr:hypothetical protein [Streptomyces acidicola]MPY48018.1 hypothetical protein [Streptomyces acidicola]
MNDPDQEVHLGGSGRNAQRKSLPSAVLDDVVDAEPLSGKAVNDVSRLTLADGTRLVLKGSVGGAVGPVPIRGGAAARPP